MSDLPRFRFRLPDWSRSLLAIVVVLLPASGETASADEKGDSEQPALKDERQTRKEPRFQEFQAIPRAPKQRGAVEAAAGDLPGDVVDDLSEDDDFDPRVAAARIEQIRLGLAERFNSHFNGILGFKSSDAFEAGIKLILHIKVENAAHDYGLTEVQKQKLRLAGRGDFQRLMDRIDDARRQFVSQGANADPVDQDRRLRSLIRPFSDLASIVPFREGSLYSKVLRRDLTAEQISSLTARDEIELYRGGISTLMRGPVEFIDIEFTNCRSMNDKSLARAIRLPNLRLLRLENTGVSDAGLESLKGQSSLEVLDLSRTQIHGTGFVHLQGLMALQVLAARGTPIGDDGLAHLKGLTHLAEMHLQGTQITDAGLIELNLPNFANLKEIGLSRTQVTDVGLAQLQKCTKLERLSLIRTHITDAGLKNLGAMKNLQQLLIDQTQITDSGMAELAQLTALERIDLSDTRVGDSGL